MRKYLLITPSFNRPYMLRQCIHNAKNQTYKNFIHSIAIQGDKDTDYKGMYDDIIDSRWVINYYQKPDLHWPRSIHENHKNALKQISYSLYKDIDYVVKFDDDDIQKSIYLQEIDNLIEENPDYNVFSFKLKNLLNNYHLETGDYRNLGGVPEEYGMPMTLVFDKKALNSLLILNEEKEDTLWAKYNGADDTIWANYWKDIGLKIKPCTATDNLIWHIHGNNVSTGEWVKS